MYGQNLYYSSLVESDGAGGWREVIKPAGTPRNSLGWALTPKRMYWGTRFLYDRYQKPLLITENGMACHDAVFMDGRVHDPNRIDYTQRYLLELEKAIDEGVDVRGYFHWSLMDNFEWSEGYHERIGLVYVDYQTQERIIKDSGYWYKKVIETNGESLREKQYS
jgi:beta-glucosidase